MPFRWTRPVLRKLATERGLLGVRKFLVPKGIAGVTLKFLRKRGRRRLEGFVLWTGSVRDDCFFFERAIIPAQTAASTDEGLLVAVDGEELFRINSDSYRRGEVIAAQVHSHPTDAYHSDTDDQFPLVTLLGAISGVVPDFARSSPRLEEWAWYRLIGPASWQSVEPSSMFEII